MKFLSWFTIAMFTALTLAMACGDDDPAVPAGDDDDDDVDPLEGVDCEEAGEDEDKCEYLVCGGSDDVDLSDVDSKCAADYVDCFFEACPEGEDSEDMDVEAVGDCVLEMAECVEEAGSGDDDDDDDNDNDNDNDDDDLADPFEDYDCGGDDGDDAEKCDFSACLIAETWDAVVETCEEVEEELEDYCDAVVPCYEDYVSCYADACAPGDDVADADEDDLASCSEDYDDCFSDAQEEM